MSSRWEWHFTFKFTNDYNSDLCITESSHGTRENKTQICVYSLGTASRITRKKRAGLGKRTGRRACSLPVGTFFALFPPPRSLFTGIYSVLLGSPGVRYYRDMWSFMHNVKQWRIFQLMNRNLTCCCNLQFQFCHAYQMREHAKAGFCLWIPSFLFQF